ncbi:type II secretion system protein, partial [bacterium]|nr:type II secretion system protein [bacterium]
MSGGGAFLANLLSKKKKAFTLAETLIALVIIGVVSALTLPTL